MPLPARRTIYRCRCLSKILQRCGGVVLALQGRDALLLHWDALLLRLGVVAAFLHVWLDRWGTHGGVLDTAVLLLCRRRLVVLRSYGVGVRVVLVAWSRGLGVGVTSAVQGLSAGRWI